jgi:hypothetical protein
MPRFKLARFSIYAALFVMGVSVTSAASATTFPYPLLCGGCTPTGPAGQVAVTDIGTGTLSFQVTLFDTLQFVGGTDAFAFNLTVSPTITFSNFTPDTFTGSNTTAGNFTVGSVGPFLYGVTAPGSGPDGQSFNFDLTATSGLTLLNVGEAFSSFMRFFAADLCPVSAVATQCDTDATTGGSVTFYAYTLRGGSNSPEPTPLPAALPLFATGLGALGLLGWRRKRKAAA